MAAALGFAADAGAAPRNFFGVSSVAIPTASEFQRIAAGGARGCRLQLYWGNVEPTPGARNWAGLDAIVANSTAAGIKVLPVLFGTPPWVSSSPYSPPIQTPEIRAAWVAFVGDLARRYGSGGTFWALHPELPVSPITAWQLWNEVNLSFYWGGKPNARRYVDLLKLTRSALRAADPASELILSGLIPFKSAAPEAVGGERYLQRLYKIKGVRKLFDAVAIHPYGKSPSIVLKSLDQIRKLLNSFGARRVPIWVTEFGWSTGGDGWAQSPFRATPAQQAARVKETYGLMSKMRKPLRVRRAFYFSLADFDQPTGVDDWTSRMGLFDINGQPKPAWSAYVRQAGGQP